VREGILSLRTSLHEDRGLADTLDEYVLLWQEQSGIKAELDADSLLDGALPELAEVQLLRIVQEALTNVRKHAGATKVRVTIRRNGGEIVTTVADDGVGIAPKSRPTIGVPQFGMSTMRERAEALGGTLEVESKPQEGTTIIVRLPASTTDRGGAGL
jgi:signal transduction histidine kinase